MPDLFDDEFFQKFRGLAPEHFVARGKIVLDARHARPVEDLLAHRVLPAKGWTDAQVEFLLTLLAAMDTDKDPDAARVGEREARVASALVSRLAAGFCHGVGRSGDVTAPQPKAPGGTVMYRLANALAKSFLKEFGIPTVKAAVVLPVGTGMSLALCLLAIRAEILRARLALDPDSKEPLPSPCTVPGFPHKVLLPRCDHRSPLKAIQLAGFTVEEVPGERRGDAVVVPVAAVEEALSPEVAAIVSTTTFFPPRQPDDVKAIAKLARARGVAHVINNAYGVQHPAYMKQVYAASSAGRVDYVVQSTDKNFLSPVGGTVVAAFTKAKVRALTRQYAGRATAAPVVQFLAAALSLGKTGYARLREQQQANRHLLQAELEALAGTLGERVLALDNPIATAMTLETLAPAQLEALGGILYNLRVTGPRVLVPSPSGWGTNLGNYPVPYVVMNAAIGAERAHVTEAVRRLGKAVRQVQGVR